MTLVQLTARAKRIRSLFDAAAKNAGRLPWTRAELAQGFSGDVGMLMKLVMMKEGRRSSRHKNLDAALAHELADCLWSVLILAASYDIELEGAYERMTSELERELTPKRRTKTARTSRARPGLPAPRSRNGQAKGL